jgi:hypothetical protein
MTNNQVFTAFANRAAANGGSTRSVRTTGGVVLYSYATPIAFYGDEMATPTFTTRKFSVTTSKQQRQAKSACGGYSEMDEPEFRERAVAVGAYFGAAR